MNLLASGRGGLSGGAKPATIKRGMLADRTAYAVGDIHGRSDLLAKMLDRLESEHPCAGEAPIVVFLGDYVDRGPDARGVIDLLLTGRPRGFERRCLIGNHEQMLLAFLDEPLKHRAWLETGGLETILSYGAPPVAPTASIGAIEAAAARFRERLPEAHRVFLRGLERYVVLGGYALVHAGVNPDKRLERQSDADLLWIRKKFLQDRRLHDYVIVHGHTPDKEPYRDERRICVDTGAYLSGRLTAAKLHGAEVEFITVART